MLVIYSINELLLKFTLETYETAYQLAFSMLQYNYMQSALHAITRLSVCLSVTRVDQSNLSAYTDSPTEHNTPTKTI